MADDFLGSIFSAGSNLIGGLIGQDFQRSQANKNRDLQLQFAKSGIQWKVQDAIAAGLNPYFALGAGTSMPSVSVGDSPLARSVSAAGQDIGRAINATRSGADREQAFSDTMRDLQVRKSTLELDLLASKVARLRDQGNPPMPTGKGQADKDNVYRDPAFGDYRLGEQPNKGRTQLFAGGTKFRTDPGTSDTQDAENRYGDFIADTVWGPYVVWRDFNNHYIDPAADWMTKHYEGIKNDPIWQRKMFNRK